MFWDYFRLHGSAGSLTPLDFGLRALFVLLFAGTLLLAGSAYRPRLGAALALAYGVAVLLYNQGR